MTWHFDPSGTIIDIYDHSGTQVASGREFSGSWSGVPQVVLGVMYEEPRTPIRQATPTGRFVSSRRPPLRI